MRWSPIIASALGGALALGILFSAPAAQARVFVGVGIGVPGPVYYPAPVVVAPPPVLYAPPPIAYVTPPAPAGQDCREYRSQTTIDGRPQDTVGTACRQPDGSWRIVN